MLSILIPVKNFNCSELITALHKQGEALGFPYEILIAEDGTDKEKLHLNAVADNLKNCRVALYGYVFCHLRHLLR